MGFLIDFLRLDVHGQLVHKNLERYLIIELYICLSTIMGMAMAGNKLWTQLFKIERRVTRIKNWKGKTPIVFQVKRRGNRILVPKFEFLNVNSDESFNIFQSSN